jgi:hypothetical protein
VNGAWMIGGLRPLLAIIPSHLLSYFLKIELG